MFCTNLLKLRTLNRIGNPIINKLIFVRYSGLVLDIRYTMLWYCKLVLLLNRPISFRISKLRL